MAFAAKTLSVEIRLGAKTIAESPGGFSPRYRSDLGIGEPLGLVDSADARFVKLKTDRQVKMTHCFVVM